MGVPIPPFTVVISGSKAEAVPVLVTHTILLAIQGLVTSGSATILIFAVSDITESHPFPSKFNTA